MHILSHSLSLYAYVQGEFTKFTSRVTATRRRQNYIVEVYCRKSKESTAISVEAQLARSADVKLLLFAFFDFDCDIFFIKHFACNIFFLSSKLHIFFCIQLFVVVVLVLIKNAYVLVHFQFKLDKFFIC